MDWDIYHIIQQFKVDNELAIFKKWLRRQSNRSRNTSEKLLHLLENPSVIHQTEEELWEALQGKQAFTPKTFAKYRHDLKAKCLDFIAEQMLKANPVLKGNLIAEGLLGRDLNELLTRHLRHHQKSYSSASLLKTEDHHAYARFLDIGYQHSIKQQQVHFNALPEVWQAYDKAWMINSLRMACLWYSLMAVKDLGGEHRPFFLPFIEQFLAAQPAKKHEGLLYAYAELYVLLSGKTKNPELISDWLQEQETPEPGTDLLDIFWLLHNYLIRQMNEGDFSHWGNYLLESYRWGLKRQFFYQGSHILPTAYRNLILTAIRCGKPRIAWEYLQQLKADLPPDEQAENYRYCLGYYHYSQKDYREMRKAWKGYHPASRFLEVVVRLLRLQARYEEYVLWQMKDDLFLVREELPLLQRSVAEGKGISETHKAHFAHRFAYFQQLLELDIHQESDLTAFAMQVAQDSNLDNHAWFLEQTNNWLELIRESERRPDEPASSSDS